jgi:hypothetical protein
MPAVITMIGASTHAMDRHALTADDGHVVMTMLDRDGAEHLRYADGDRGFAAFLLGADTLAWRRLGVSIFDLEDACWRDFYDQGMTPGEALRAARDAA